MSIKVCNRLWGRRRQIIATCWDHWKGSRRYGKSPPHLSKSENLVLDFREEPRGLKQEELQAISQAEKLPENPGNPKKQKDPPKSLPQVSSGDYWICLSVQSLLLKHSHADSPSVIISNIASLLAAMHQELEARKDGLKADSSTGTAEKFVPSLPLSSFIIFASLQTWPIQVLLLDSSCTFCLAYHISNIQGVAQNISLDT